MKKLLHALPPLAVAIVSFLASSILPYAFGMLIYLALGQLGVRFELEYTDLASYVGQTLVFGVIYHLMVRGKLGPRMDVSLGKGAASAAILGLGVSGISYLWLVLAKNALSGIDFIAESLQIMEKGNESLTMGILPLAVLSVCVLGPIMEELLFRGIICGCLERVTKVSWVPVVVSGLLFGIWHGLFVQGVSAAAMGIILALVYHKTHDLRWPILIHIVNNAFRMLSVIPAFAALAPIPDIFTVAMIVPSAYVLYKMVRGGDSDVQPDARHRGVSEAA